jgi:hypothetical protein
MDAESWIGALKRDEIRMNRHRARSASFVHLRIPSEWPSLHPPQQAGSASTPTNGCPAPMACLETDRMGQMSNPDIPVAEVR